MTLKSSHRRSTTPALPCRLHQPAGTAGVPARGRRVGPAAAVRRPGDRQGALIPEALHLRALLEDLLHSVIHSNFSFRITYYLEFST